MYPKLCLRVTRTAALMVCGLLAGFCLSGASAGTVYFYSGTGNELCDAASFDQSMATSNGQCATVPSEPLIAGVNVTCATSSSDSAWTMQAWSYSDSCSSPSVMTSGTGRACVTSSRVNPPVLIDCAASTTSPPVATNSLFLTGARGTL